MDECRKVDERERGMKECKNVDMGKEDWRTTGMWIGREE